ncbi:MAG: hypothetical protein Q8R00_02950 [Candidatus Nanoarchaeia archaeon]|nr:hypothetical protein [Candidatus Nanoarchaeia archaeon]
MNPFAQMFLDMEKKRPSKKSDFELKLESEGWSRVSNYHLVSRIDPGMRLALSTDEELHNYYNNTVGYREVLVTKAHNRFGELMSSTVRAVYVKGEPKKFEVSV